MKTGRRQDPEGQRRLSREREAALGRVRKRPSMLLEFQGKHYNHRDTSRDRFHHRYDQQQDSGSGLSGGGKRNRFGPFLFKSEMTAAAESRHFPSQPRSHHPSSSSSFSLHSETTMEMNNSHEREEVVPLKRPRLLGDMKLGTRLSSTESLSSGPVPMVGSVARDQPVSPLSSPPRGLSAYLEDIDSDEGDLLTVDEDENPPESSHRTPKPSSLSQTTPSPHKPSQLTKEQLLQRIEAVDREITATEAQINALIKKQAELEGAVPLTTPSPLHLSTLSPPGEEEGRATLSEERRGPRRTLLDSLYSENKLKAQTAHSSLHHLSPVTLSRKTTLPLYMRPCEAPGYFDLVSRHSQLRSSLVQLIRRRKRETHNKEVRLCEKYDTLQEEWKKRLDKIETSSKKKARDSRNRELFERTFPELKIRREQQERLMRVDQRGFGVVRSDLELTQVMCELYEQEEAPARCRRTHALIPAMIMDRPEERVSFHDVNGLIKDPMSLYRSSRLTNVWTDEEKTIFREKYALYPKNFEAIASFLSRKTTADCVRHYYLSKKSEKFKQAVRKATFKRRKFIKPGEMSGIAPTTPSRLGIETKIRSPLLSEVMMTPQTPPTTATPTVTTPTTPRLEEFAKEEPLAPKPSRYGDWTDEDISNLRSGLRRWGRAWSKIYREVGGRKTATQCKKFFDDFCQDMSIGLGQAVKERSSIQNEEKAQRKAANRKPAPPPTPPARKRGGKGKIPHQQTAESRLHQEVEEEKMRDDRDGENEMLDIISAPETGSAEEEGSGSESTLTDSCPEDGGTLSTSSSLQQHHWKSHASSASPSHSNQSGPDKGAFDIFISAAEALKNLVPPEVALHDHNYALAPLNSVDLQGTSGLSLIAAAAAVVSPTLSRSSGLGKFPSVSPVRAPRGRPPNTQRRGSSGSSCKLSPTLLSPAGSSIYVPLTDTTKPSFRNRARSAPSDRPRIQLSRAGPSNLRYSISSKAGSPRPILPPASYTRTKDPSGPISATPSLKSMIASRPPPHSTSSGGSGSGNAAFETLVNVAVAASPAELPRATSTAPTATLSISFQNTSSGSTPSSPAISTGTSEGTYSIDMNQAVINILSLAQLTQTSTSSTPPSSSSTVGGSKQLLLTPGVGSQTQGFLVGQSNQNGGSAKTPNTNTVNVLIGHLTSGASSPTPSLTGSDSSSRSSSVAAADPPHKPLLKPLAKPLTKSLYLPTTSKPPLPPPLSSSSSVRTVSTSAGEDLSNLNLLSSLVAVVAGSQTTPTNSTHQPTTSTHMISSSSTSSLPKPSQPTALSSLSISKPSSSAFKATNLPASSSSAKTKENCLRTKIHEKLPPSLSNNDSSSRSSSLHGPSSSLDNLARSVVRSTSLTHAQSSLTTANSSSSHSHSPPIPAYPSPSPSISQQSTLLLYTRSLSLPNTSSVDHSSEEEDHLESATRGISELSKLLGTDTEPLSSSSSSSSSHDSHSSTSYRNSWSDQPLPPPPSSIRSSRTSRSPARQTYPIKTDLANDSGKYLSGLLESHSSSHASSHSSHAPHSQKTSCSNTNTDINSSHDTSR